MNAIDGLLATYKIDSDSNEFLQTRPKVVLALYEAIEPIEQAFGELPGLSLEILHECCSQMLFVKIETPLSAEDALAQLNHFDTHWWFQMPHDVHNGLEFTLKFIEKEVTP